MIRLFSICWFSMVLVLAAVGQTKPETRLVDVELTVRGPDGKPAVHASVALAPRDRAYFDPKIPDIEAETDDQGVARFKTPEGVYRFFVTVRGIGSGQIGTTEFMPGRIARPYLPPLLAYGSVDGTFPVDACPSDVTIHASVTLMREEITVKPDAPGHFHIADAPDGQWRVRVTASNQQCAASEYFRLEPGQHLRDVSVLPAKPEIPSPPATSVTPAPQPAKEKQSVVWFRGTVRNESGSPITGAKVMALATFQGAIRMYQVTSQAVTDKDGHYELIGEGGLPSFSATLVASAPGYPPAWAWPAIPHGDSAKDSVPPVQDLILSSKSGKLNVTVLRDGKPVAGISVAAYLENANLRDMWAMPAGGSSKEIEDAAYPVVKTDADGFASFENLLPGRYRILATQNAVTVRNSLYGLGTLAGITAQSTGTAVRVGETTSYTMKLYEQRNAVSFHAAQPDGIPVTGTAAISFGPADAIQWSSSEQFDSSGSAKRELGHAGLWQMRVMFRDSALHTFPIQEPYYLASGYVAASPNLDSRNVPIFQGLRIEPGSAKITVQNLSGNPLRVSVQLSDGFGGDKFSGSTDERGEITFTGLTSGKKYFIRLSSTSQTDVQCIGLGKFLVRPVGRQPAVKDIDVVAADWNTPLPPPEEMRAEPGILEQMFVAQPNTQTRILMRAIPFTYVYGVLRPPKGAKDSGWGVWVDYPLQRQGVKWRGHYGTNEYLIGPFPPGEVRLNFGTNTERVVYHATVNVGSNERGPIRFDIDAEKYPSEVIGTPPDPLSSGPDTVVMGMGGISARAGGAHGLAGKVFTADGSTPALGAQVLYFQAHRTAPSLLAMTDALGNLQPRGLWYAGSTGNDKADPGTASPTVVAFLPGTCGAVVMTPSIRAGEPLRLVLPVPIAINGRVTVGGGSPFNRPGSIRVLAAFQGRGFLNPYLSVETTADVNGNFELAGLTPGDYLVQAALDDIWLSSPVALHVTNQQSRPIKLDIRAPGAPIRIELRDRSGRPAVGTTITLERLGPLATLWPREWMSDGAGSVYVPTLEAGRHTIHVPGISKPFRFKVPPLPAKPMVVRVSIDHLAAGLIKVGGAAPYDPMGP